MAEETKGENLPSRETSDVNHKQQDDRNGKSRRDVKREDTPIEELFDLSKSIPRVRELHNTCIHSTDFNMELYIMFIVCHLFLVYDHVTLYSYQQRFIHCLALLGRKTKQG